MHMHNFSYLVFGKGVNKRTYAIEKKKASSSYGSGGTEYLYCKNEN